MANVASPFDGDHSQDSGTEDKETYITESSNNLSSSTESTEEARKFTCFRKLPVELRLKIWRNAMPGPRVIELLYRVSKRRLFTDCKTPAILHACIESRRESLKKYEVLKIENTVSGAEYYELGNAFNKHKNKLRAAGKDVTGMERSLPPNFGYFYTYINYDRDTLYLPYRQYHQDALNCETKMWQIVAALASSNFNDLSCLQADPRPAITKLKHFATQASLFAPDHRYQGILWLFKVLFSLSENLTTLNVVYDDEDVFDEHNLQGLRYTNDGKLVRVGRVKDLEEQILDVPVTTLSAETSQASRYKVMVTNCRNYFSHQIKSCNASPVDLSKRLEKLAILPVKLSREIQERWWFSWNWYFFVVNFRNSRSAKLNQTSTHLPQNNTSPKKSRRQSNVKHDQIDTIESGLVPTDSRTMGQDSQLSIMESNNNVAIQGASSLLEGYASSHYRVIEILYKAADYRFFANAKPPAILYACSEPRQEGLKCYEVLSLNGGYTNDEEELLDELFEEHMEECKKAGQDVSQMERSQPPLVKFRTYFNYDQDILYLPHSNSACGDWKLYNILTDLAAEKIKHVAFQKGLFDERGGSLVPNTASYFLEEARNLATLRLVYDDVTQEDGCLWKESSLVRAGFFLGFEEQPVEASEDPETSAKAENYNKDFGNIKAKVSARWFSNSQPALQIFMKNVKFIPVKAFREEYEGPELVGTRINSDWPEARTTWSW